MGSQVTQRPTVWFVVGSQHLYGPEVLAQVAEHASRMVANWNVDRKLSVDVLAKPVMTSSEEVRNLIQEANQDSNCAGLILWMHTFSPAKMWISGLSQLTKPFLHLHTQFNRDLPWESID
ncbi:MAG TPA: L-arabinose isomerase, partial [Fimbriimonadaceae bacterium]|nr:L-arabinose isomerase [Fimbriimonadaceae bacterium]